MWTRRSCLLLALLISAVVAYRLPTINRPYLRSMETSSAQSLVANYLRFGPAAMRWATLLNIGRVDRANWVPYAHHPPLVPLLTAGVQAVAGRADWTMRLVPLLFMLGSTILVFQLTWRAGGAWSGLLAGMIFAFCPMMLVFGSMVDYINIQVVFFGLATVASYFRWLDTRGWGWAVIWGGSFVLGALSSWFIFPLVPVLAGHLLLKLRREALRPVAVLLSGAILMLAGLISWMAWAGSDHSFLDLLAHRSFNRGPIQDSNFGSAGDWIRWVILRTQVIFHTWPVLLLAVGYGAFVIRLAVRRRWDALRQQQIPLVVLAWGLLHMVAGAQIVYQHEWHALLLTPGLAMAAAVATGELLGVVRRVGGRAWPAAVLGSVAMAGFLVLSIHNALPQLADTLNDAETSRYSLKDLGLAIRSVAAEEEGVLTTDYGIHPGLYYYADRQLRIAVISPGELDRELAPGPYSILFSQKQPDGPAPRWFVIPPPHLKEFGDLVRVLDERFPQRSVNGCRVYQLY